MSEIDRLKAIPIEGGGVEFSDGMPLYEDCPTCDGDGYIALPADTQGLADQRCPRCDGSSKETMMTEIEKYKDRILDWKGSCYGDGLTFGECLDALIAAVRAEALEDERQKAKAATVRQSLMIVDLYYAGHREGWEPGESNEQIVTRAHDHLCNIGLDPYTNGGPEAIALLRERQQADDLDIRRALKGTATQSPWMPIETAPKDGTGFIGYERVHDGMYVISSCCFDTTIGEFVFVEFSSQSNCEARPTHWMPLPAPPTEEAG